MATYFTNFNEYSTGSLASDWTERWDSSSVWTVETGGADKILHCETASTSRQLVSWNDIDGDGTRDNCEILAKISTDSVQGSSTHCGVVLRASGSNTAETGYVVAFFGDDLRLSRFNAATSTALQTTSLTLSTGTWYWVRARVNGTGATVTITVKLWADGGSESSPLASTTYDDTSTDRITAAGWLGVYCAYNGADTDCDQFGVGTNGDTAPASTGGATTLTAEVGSFTLSGTATGLTVQRKLVAEAASFTLTGNDSALSGQHKLTTASASFVLTGNGATLGSQKSIAVDFGEFTLTGVDSGLTVTRNLTAEPGVFGLLWKDAELTYGSAGAYTMPASTGNFALTGKDIITKAARKMPATVVSFTTTGVAASLLFGRKVIATSQSYTLQQNPANFLYKRKFLADTASFVLDRLEASLHYSGSGGYLMPATTKSFALTGIAAGLRITRYMNAVPVEFFLTGNSVKYPTTSGDWSIVSDSANLWTDVSDTANTWVNVP